MSSDNFYLIRKHPNGGFAAVMGFASAPDDQDWPVRPDHDQSFPTIAAALLWADSQYSEYGAFIHAECGEDDRRVAVGYMTADGELHKGCPPLDTPEGWKPVYVDG